MTKLLQKAFTAAAELPEEEQDEFGRWLLSELSSERRWEQAFSRSKDRFAEMAREALIEDQAGETEELNPDTL